MRLIRAAERSGTSGKTGSQFTGQVFNYLTMPATDGIVINTVTFNPGARTFWHSHTDGQILEVVAGCGLVQSEGGPAVSIVAGDTVWVPAGERHWHGAAPDSFMTHTAISLGPTNWDQEVADSEYDPRTDETEQR
ncbi:cupin domain-containing protein [Naasia lichenicola]|uniref:Cupin domain-containing protein n=1 Tax=Naasia lichenicola TaxID=2565933 RepID=A0A4S4FNX2_9MICO|nr:cupin domain-containing protein [Naasia lichenicola]THG31532.1 cupin domain-containing protein [Naasia lichenicola]